LSDPLSPEYKARAYCYTKVHGELYFYKQTYDSKNKACHKLIAQESPIKVKFLPLKNASLLYATRDGWMCQVVGG